MSKKLIGVAVAAASVALTMVGGPAQARPDDDKKKAPSAPVTAVADSASPDRGSRGPATDPATDKALAKLQARIAKHVKDRGARNTFASYVDARTGKIVLDTDASDAVVASLTGGEANLAAVVKKKSTTKDNWHRRDDIPSYWGGGGLLADGALCSSGYAVRRNSTNVVHSTTAGHCYAFGRNVRTESNARFYGTVSLRRLPTVSGHASDMELLGGSTYSGRVFTGGTTSTSSIPVVSAGGASVGYNNYCHSGRTTGEQCGHTAISTNAQVCTSSGCKSPVIAYQGGVVQQGGDSGGAFYAKDSRGAFIRGHVIAGNSTTGYIQPWTVVASTLNVSIVTG